MKDVLGRPVAVGDKVLYAHTSSHRGIHWATLEVSRLTEKSFWVRKQYANQTPYEDGPKKLANCVRLDGQA